MACDPGGELILLEQPEVTANASENTIELDWSDVEGAKRYHIYQSNTEVFNKDNAVSYQSNESHFIIDNLENNKTYYIAITSIGETGESDIKTIVSSTPKSPPPAPPPPPKPTAPNIIKAIPGTEAITLSWNDIPEATQYNLYIARSPGITKDNIETLSGWMIRENISSPFTQTGLINGKIHYIVLTAINESGESPLSEELQVIPTQSLKITMGDGHTCSILVDLSLWCWGNNNKGQLGDGSFESKSTPVRVAAETEWRDVSAGPQHTCGIAADDKLWCWGNNEFSRLGSLQPNSVNKPILITDKGEKWSTVSVGQDITCGILKDENKNFICWGKQDFLPSLIPTSISELELDQWNNVYVNGLHNCALKKDETLWCWGENLLGQLGNGAYSTIKIPFQNSMTPVSSIEGWASIALSSSIAYPKDAYTCGIKTNGELWCWGSNMYGQLGIPYILKDSENPFPVSTNLTWKTVAAGQKHACAISSDSTLWCMGKSPYGQSGIIDNYASVNTLTQYSSETNWTQIVANNETSCARKNDGSIWCTGRNNNGQLGVNSYGFAEEPVAVMTEVDQFSVSDNHVCLQKNVGEIWCWGSNKDRQLGEGLSFDRASPTKLKYLKSQNPIHASKKNTCIASQKGSILCWGNFQKSRGNTFAVPESFFSRRDSYNNILTIWHSVAQGDINLCAIATDKTLWCLEDFITLEKHIAENKFHTLWTQELTKIGENTWLQLSLTANQACAIDSLNILWCWGINEYGELGTENKQNYPLPEKVYTNELWQSVSVGRTHTCAISTSDELWCWGNNEHGQLGIESTTNQNTPIKIPSDIGWQYIQVSDTRSCGIKYDNSLWCWGIALPTSNKLPNELLPKHDSPQRIAEHINWKYVGIGDRFICALNTNNVLYCWGDNANGEIGNGKAWSSEWVQVEFPQSKVTLK